MLLDIEQRLAGHSRAGGRGSSVSVLIGVPLGVAVATNRGGIADRLVFVYGMLAGSLPDFWIGLLLILVFFFALNGHRRPSASSTSACPTPDHITGAYIVDAALTGDWQRLRLGARQHRSAARDVGDRLHAPGAQDGAFFNGGDARFARFVLQAKASGLSRWMQLRYALRNALPPVVTVTGILFWFLLGGTVLVETIFAWGGLGQYAVELVINSDYAPIQAVVLVMAVFTTLVFLFVDILYFLLDPRIWPDPSPIPR